MTLTIVIPDDANFLENNLDSNTGAPSGSRPETRDTDWDAFYWSLSKCSKRPVLYYEESFTGYVIHTAPIECPLPPKTVFVNFSSTYDNIPDALGYKSRETQPIVNVQQGAETSSAVNEEKEVKTSKIDDLLWQGKSRALSESTVNVTIWKFKSSVGCPQRETSGQIQMSVSATNPDLAAGSSKNKAPSSRVEAVPGRDENSVHSTNLLEELNHSVVKKPSRTYELFVGSSKEAAAAKPQHRKNVHASDTKDAETAVDSAELASHLQAHLEKEERISVATSAPLQLKLRTTKPSGRSDLLLTNLRIEAPESLVSFALGRKKEKYSFYILGLDAELKGGQITQLGDVSFPRRCDLNDVLNITYKLVSEVSEPTPESTLADKGSSTAKPINIKVRVRIEKKCVAGLSEDEPWVQITDDISTTWTPILEFDSMAQTPNLHLKPQTPQGISQSQFRSKSTHLKPSQPGALPKKSVTIKNFASTSTLPLPNSPYSPRPGWTRPSSPNPLRPMTPNKSSPLLSMSRGGLAKKKAQRSVFSQPGTQNITINLAGESASVLSGLRLVFSGTPKVALGTTVSWQVQAINQTNRLVKLTLTANSVRRIPSSYSYSVEGSAPSSSHNTLVSKDDKRPPKGPTIQSRLSLYEQYNLSKAEKTGVVILSNDVGLGVLEPNQVYESEFSFIAFSKGIYNLNGLRVVEATTGEAVDIGRLLEVYVT